MFKPLHRRPEALKEKLAMSRQMTSLMERAFLSEGPHLRRCRKNWVNAWIDDGHRIEGDDPKVHVLRGITDEGQLVWMVHHADKRDAYHAMSKDPVAAMDEAAIANRRRRAIKARWSEVEDLRRNVLARRLRYRVTLDDAEAAGLCRLGAQGFLRRLGCADVTEVSALWLSLASMIDDRASFALFAAAEREGLLERTQPALSSTVAHRP